MAAREVAVAGPRCAAGVYEERGSYAEHQCRNRAWSERAVGRAPEGGVRRIPVCRRHLRQKRLDFHEYRGVVQP